MANASESIVTPLFSSFFQYAAALTISLRWSSPRIRIVYVTTVGRPPGARVNIFIKFRELHLGSRTATQSTAVKSWTLRNFVRKRRVTARVLVVIRGGIAAGIWEDLNARWRRKENTGGVEVNAFNMRVLARIWGTEDGLRSVDVTSAVVSREWIALKYCLASWIAPLLAKKRR